MREAHNCDEVGAVGSRVRHGDLIATLTTQTHAQTPEKSAANLADNAYCPPYKEGGSILVVRLGGQLSVVGHVEVGVAVARSQGHAEGARTRNAELANADAAANATHTGKP